MKGERLGTSPNSSSQAQMPAMVQIRITRNRPSFLTNNRHFNASINRTTNRIHLRPSNPRIAERAVCTSRQKNHQADQKHQSHKRTTTLERTTKRQLFPVLPPAHHSASSLPAISDLHLEKKQKRESFKVFLWLLLAKHLDQFMIDSSSHLEHYRIAA